MSQNSSQSSLHEGRYTIRSLTLDHLPWLLDLDQICYGGHWGEQGYRSELTRDSSLVLGGFESSNLIGFGILWRVLEEAHIISLAVHPHHRRQGIARSLLQGLLKEADHQGCAWATLEVRESNHPARNLYESAGFQLLGRRQRYYEDTGEDALIYWKKPLG